MYGAAAVSLSSALQEAATILPPEPKNWFPGGAYLGAYRRVVKGINTSPQNEQMPKLDLTDAEYVANLAKYQYVVKAMTVILKAVQSSLLDTV